MKMRYLFLLLPILFVSVSSPSEAKTLQIQEHKWLNRSTQNVARQPLNFYLSLAAQENLMDKVDRSPALVLFYSENCTPCHTEMKMVENIQQAAHGWHIAVLSLTEMPVNLVKKLQQLSIQHIVVTESEGLGFLRGINDNAVVLPFSLALDQKGKICGRRMGLLGLDIIKDWRRKCST